LFDRNPAVDDARGSDPAPPRFRGCRDDVVEVVDPTSPTVLAVECSTVRAEAGNLREFNDTRLRLGSRGFDHPEGELRMFYKQKKLFAAVAAVVVLAAGCGSSKSSAGGPASTGAPASAGGTASTGGGGSTTYTVGLLTDLTGLGASSSKSSVQGVQAGIAEAAKEGYHIKMVVADTATSPAQVLSGAQKLVDQDHVSAVIAISGLTFAAAHFLTSRGVVVLGAAQDGPEWMTSMNMFSVYGPLDLTKVATTFGKFLKMVGGTNLGVIGYGISPSSAESAKGNGVSAQAAGIKLGYVNANFPFGGTNVGPVVLAMKAAGVDSVTGGVVPATVFALNTALRQQGVKVKVVLMPTGYGADLAEGGPAAATDAQGLYFQLAFQPVEMQTAATKQFQSALSSVGVTGDPGQSMYLGYATIDMFLRGLKVTGPNPTPAALISALSGIKDFDAWGLLGSHTLDLGQRTGIVNGPGNCDYFTKYVGSTFQLVPGADPLCGDTIPGKTVSPNS
jgi:branched-chain amino acid transport system substrate-binding protein